MGSKIFPLHSFGRLARASSLCLVALASLTGCTLDESNSPRRTNSTATGSTDPSGTGAGKTGGPASGAGGSTTGTTGTNGTGTGGGGPGSTGTSTGTGSTATGTGTGTTTSGGTTAGGGAGTGSGGSGTGAGGSGVGGSGGSTGGGGPGTGGAGPGTPDAGGPVPDAGRPPGMPPGAEKILGIEFMQRIAGKWTGMNQSGPLGAAFPMTVEFAPNTGFMYGKLQMDPQNTVVWGFNIETYGGKDVLAYRNGGYLGGARRDSRLQLVEYDAAKAYYRFCAVKESGIPVDGCNYIEAKYTFTAPDKMLFVVTTRPERKPHVHWDATRTETRPVPDPFPASIASQGQGEAPWPPGAGL
jgi:hypothetical protein